MESIKADYNLFIDIQVKKYFGFLGGRRTRHTKKGKKKKEKEKIIK